MTSRRERGRERTVGDEELQGLRESEAGEVVVDEVVGVADGVVFLGSGEGGQRGAGVERGGGLEGCGGIVVVVVVVLIVLFFLLLTHFVTILLTIITSLLLIIISLITTSLLITLTLHNNDLTSHLLLPLLHHHIHQRRHVNQRGTRTRLLHRRLLRAQRTVDRPLVQHLPRVPLRVDERVVLVVVVVCVRQRVQLRQRQVARRVHQRRMALRHWRTRAHTRRRGRRRLLVAVLQKQQQLHLVGLRER